jgi:hypothetical protein
MATVLEAEVTKSTSGASSSTTTKAKKKAAKVAIATEPAAPTDQTNVESAAGAVPEKEPAQPKPKYGKRTIAATERMIITKARKTVAQSKEELARFKIIEQAIGQKCETIRNTLAKGDASYFEAGDQIIELLATQNPATKKSFTIREVVPILGRWTPGFICKLSVVAKECDPTLRKKLASAGITWNDVYEVCRMRRRFELEESFEVSMAQYLRMKGRSNHNRREQEVDPFAPDECVRDLIDHKRASEPRQGAVADRPFDPEKHVEESRSLVSGVRAICKERGNGNYLALVVVPNVTTGNAQFEMIANVESEEMADTFMAGALLSILNRIPASRIEPLIVKVKQKIAELKTEQEAASQAAKQAKDEPGEIISRLSHPWNENVKAADELLKKLWHECAQNNINNKINSHMNKMFSKATNDDNVNGEQAKLNDCEQAASC